MKNIGNKNRNIWLGYHKELGGIIYDEQFQQGVKKDRVRIFLLKDNRTSTFVKEILKENLNKINDEVEKNYKKSINNYLDILKKIDNGRETHCFNCKEDINSIDFELCDDCSWIICDCGTCGCNWVNNNV